jgi:hypothetical protein
MEIEVLTTKKKLTRSIVRQFRNASYEQIINFVSAPDALGYHVRDLGDSYPRNVGLFQADSGEWVLVRIRNWVASSSDLEAHAYINLFFDHDREFETKEDRDLWLENYNTAKKRLMKNHLILE